MSLQLSPQFREEMLFEFMSSKLRKYIILDESKKSSTFIDKFGQYYPCIFNKVN
jgi:hypothetical protein